MGVEIESKVKFRSVKKTVAAYNSVRSLRVSSETFEYPCHCSITDMDWNHLDQEHRPHIHKTYGEAVRLASGENFAVSFTKLRFAGIPVLVTVSDVRIGSGRFQQIYNIFGLLHIHMFSFTTEQKQTVEWLAVSHWLLRPLHGILLRRLKKMNTRVNIEDTPVRLRRRELRDQGYRFKSDPPNYINSNNMRNNTIYPPLTSDHSISLDTIPERRLTKIKVGALDFLILKEPGEFIRIWPAACPHEGAELLTGKQCDSEIRCFWHGLTFKSTNLSNENDVTTLLDQVSVRLKDRMLHFSPIQGKKKENSQQRSGETAHPVDL